MLKWDHFSESLLVRSVYLITLPIVLVQVVGIIIFFELHWDLVLKRSAQSIVNDIKILELTKNTEEIDKFANTLQIIKTDRKQINEIKPISNWIFKKRINQSLSQIPGQFTASQNDNFYIVSNILDEDYYYLIPKKRIETKTVLGFFLWTIAISIILSIISYFFIKKQIQPLKRLGIITKSFGRGIETPNLKPSGSSEVRGLINDFNNMQNNIKSTFENQRNMLAGISHDLKTPLTRINLMIEDLNNEEIKSAISKNISEMNIMLNHYLDFIKNEKNENLDEVITDILIYEAANNYQNISFLSNESKKVLIRKNQVKRVLINVLDNANKFAKNIYLNSTFQNDSWLIIIEDDGPGTNLTEEQLTKPFFKGPQQLNQGTGLGLSIVQKLIKLNNGELKFEKSIYGGLKVTISFEVS
ncbi:MAG: ATP-binding protein [Alphaproteobacteria bacterium]|jgi:two-component system osmolarity sensor histidine kinase EnvZ